MDKEVGGFFDSEDHMLGVKIKGIQDIPHPSANALCIQVMLKLYSITGKKDYHTYAEKTLTAFAHVAQDMGIHAGFYFSALDAYFNTVKLDIYSDPESDLSGTAKSLFVPYLNILYREDKGHAIACFKETCGEPLQDGKSLKEFFKEEKYRNR
jgi:uncharacterized protein YyaL (SSP411 family)